MRVLDCRVGIAARVLGATAAVWFSLQALPAAAAVQTFSGRLDNPGNAALVGSDLGPALFGNDWEVANNVALHPFSLAAGGVVDFASLGFAAGGADPYFTLFAGTGQGATFLASNFANATTVGGDFTISLALVAGDYTIAIGVFENLSFAENNPDADPGLGDGFIGLGGPGFLGSSYYELRVSSGDAPLPLPASAALAALGLGLLAAGRRRAAG